MIRLTPAAEQQIKTLLSRRGGGAGVRIGVKTTGCSGLAYVLEWVDTLSPDDHQWAFSGFLVLVDPKSLPYIDGTEIHWTKEGLNSGFIFKNPRERDRCGCGESFRV